MTERLVAASTIAAPWIFSFSDIESCTIASVIVGVAMLLSGAATRWRYSLVKLIPLRVHFMTDVLLGIALIVTPFIVGVSVRGDATRFMVIAGGIELLVAAARGGTDAKSSRYVHVMFRHPSTAGNP